MRRSQQQDWRSNIPLPLQTESKTRTRSYIDLSQGELTTLTARTQEEVVAGFLKQERAVEPLALANGIQDVTALQEEFAKQLRPSPAETDPAMADQGVDQALKNMSAIDRAGGKNSL